MNSAVAAFGDMRSMYLAETRKGKKFQEIETMIIKAFPKVPIREVATALNILSKEQDRLTTRS